MTSLSSHGCGLITVAVMVTVVCVLIKAVMMVMITVLVTVLLAVPKSWSRSCSAFRTLLCSCFSYCKYIENLLYTVVCQMNWGPISSGV